MNKFLLFVVLASFLRALLESNSVLAREPVATTETLLASENGLPQNPGSILATIIQSRSTNSRGYNVVVRMDGSASVEIGGASNDGSSQSQTFPPGTIDSGKLRGLLLEIGDVERIRVGHCMKSASFGTTTRIAYAGKTSGDLQCIAQSADSSDVSGNIGEFVRATLSQLKINASRR